VTRDAEEDNAYTLLNAFWAIISLIRIARAAGWLKQPRTKKSRNLSVPACMRNYLQRSR
jgi:hypothetical protein